MALVGCLWQIQGLLQVWLHTFVGCKMGAEATCDMWLMAVKMRGNTEKLAKNRGFPTGWNCLGQGRSPKNGGLDTGIPFKIWPKIVKFTKFWEIWGWCSIGVIRQWKMGINSELCVFGSRCSTGKGFEPKVRDLCQAGTKRSGQCNVDGIGVGSSRGVEYAGRSGFRVYDIRRGHYHTGHHIISLKSISLTLLRIHVNGGVLYNR